MAGKKDWTDPFYLSKEWRQLRSHVLYRDYYRCVICGADVRGAGKARVDHIKPRKTHPDLSLDERNLRTLCVLCDARSHREKGTGAKGREARFAGSTISGMPIDPMHPWNRKNN